MTDDLAKYEELKRRCGAYEMPIAKEVKRAIAELIAMVREAREDRDGFMEQLDNAALERESTKLEGKGQ